MNRNTMYDYLNSLGMKPLANYYNKKMYYIAFVADKTNQEEIFEILTDWGYIREAWRISLCSNELVVQGRFSDVKINIKYSSIEKFEVHVWDKDE